LITLSRRGIGGLDAKCIVRHANEVHVHLPSAAAKLELPEERLRSIMLSMPKCHISGNPGNTLHQLTTQVSGQSVRMPTKVWDQGMIDAEKMDAGVTLPQNRRKIRMHSDSDGRRDDGRSAMDVFRMDRNNDGGVDRKEFLAYGGTREEFDQFDVDCSGTLDAEELEELGEYRLQRTDSGYTRLLVRDLKQIKNGATSAQTHKPMAAREMIATASRTPLLASRASASPPARRTNCFGFAGGARGPAFQLQSEDNYTFDPEDVSWMERYIKNDKKSVMGMNRIHQAHKKEKQSVSDYHDRLVGDKGSVRLLTPSKMRRMSALNPMPFTTAFAKDRRFIQPGALPHGMLPCLRVQSGMPHGMPPQPRAFSRGTMCRTR